MVLVRAATPAHCASSSARTAGALIAAPLGDGLEWLNVGADPEAAGSPEADSVTLSVRADGTVGFLPTTGG